MLNLAVLMGRLVADPELRQTASGISACNFRLAVDRTFIRAGEERRADFLDVVAWKQTAEFVCKYFQKGSLIALEGTIQTRSYEDKNGNKRTVFEIVANNVHFAESKREITASGTASTFQPVSRNVSPDIEDFAVIDSEEPLRF